MHHTVYRTTNLVNQKTYIGVHSTTDLNDQYLGSGVLLQKAFKKYGRNNFSKEILFVFSDSKDAYTKERELVTEDFVNSNHTYNYTLGGGGTGPGELSNVFGKTWRLSEESKDNIRKAKLGPKNPMYGGLTDNHKEKLKSIMKDKASRGEQHVNYGKSWSDEEKEKRRVWSKEAYAKRPPLKCPHCCKEMKPNLYARYHGDNCKLILKTNGKIS